MAKVNIVGVIVPNDEKEVYEWFGIETTTPKEVNYAIEKAAGQPLDVYINSGGGSVFAGSEMYTALQEYAGGVNVKIVGRAGSAATLPAMAGKSEISPTAMMMVHRASASAEGNYHAMERSSEMLQAADTAIANAYVKKSGMSMEDAIAMMDRETWMTAQQAVEHGLVDKIMFTEADQISASEGGMLPKAVVEKIKNIIHAKSDLKGEEKNRARAEIDLLDLRRITR